MAKKVLLVEYEPRYLQRLNSVLQSKGWETEIAKDGQEALTKLQSFAPDLVFISAVLPKVRTAEVIKSIKSNPELRNTKIILLATGIKDDLIEVEKKKKEVDEILCKPFSETKVIECLQNLEPPPPETEKKVEEKEGLLDLMPKPEKKLTSEDLFGEFIEEKPAASPKAEKKGEVEDLLHKTLSSIGAAKPKKTEAIPKIETDIDKKLTETLAGIQIPSKPKKTAQIPKPEEKEIPKKIEEVVISKVEEKAEEKPPVVIKEKIEEKEEIPVVSEKEERFGNYILIEKLGTGGMAEIYKAKMEGVEGFQKLVAIKKILPQFSHNKDFTTMFIDEAKVAAQLSHRNIVHIYDLGKIENSYFIAMEYMEGTDLRKVIHEAKEKNEKIPIPIGLFIASHVASALDYAHNKKDPEGKPLNIVHRDVSPQNILISKDGEIKICDFGIAKAASKASHTRAGSLKGKLQYMSPEQAWGKQVNFKSDIFSLGIVLYEMFSGKHLFEGDSELSILEKVRHPKFQPLSKLIKDCPPELENIINKALKENEDERYPDANSMKKEIEELLSRYEPKVTEKTISEYLLYLEGLKDKFMEFKYKSAPKKEEAEPIKEPIPEKITEKKPEKEEIPLKPPEVKLPEKKTPYILEEEKSKEKKFPLWAIGAGVAAVLLIVGILFLSTGRKTEKIKEPAKIEETKKTEETPIVPTETPKTETTQVPKVEPIKKVEEKQKLAEEKKEVAPEKKVEEKPKETMPEKKEEVSPKKEEPLPEKKEIVEEVKTPQPVVETPPPPPLKVEEEKEPVNKEQVEEKKPKYKTGDLVEPTTPGLIAPKLIKKASAEYPPIAKMQRIQGKVDVKILVDENGNVIEAKAFSGHTIFRPEAEKAALKSKFSPAEIDGVKVKCYYTLSFSFEFKK